MKFLIIQNCTVFIYRGAENEKTYQFIKPLRAVPDWAVYRFYGSCLFFKSGLGYFSGGVGAVFGVACQHFALLWRLTEPVQCDTDHHTGCAPAEEMPSA